MTIDVCILAGGLGTRLRGVWDKPKCLVPIDGKPLLHILLEKLAPLQPRIVNLCLGVGASQVLWYCFNAKLPVPVQYTVEAVPQGSVFALQLALPAVSPPLLVLNGDTLPLYSLSDHMKELENCGGHVNSSYSLTCNKQNAGAMVLLAEELRKVKGSSDSNLTWLISELPTHEVPGGFLDVGTLEGFEKAKTLKL